MPVNLEDYRRKGGPHAMLEHYPSSVLTETKVYPIERAAAMYQLPLDILAAPGNLWQLQQAAADCRFGVLKLIASKGMVPVAGRDPRVVVRVEVTYDAIDAACAGIAIPERMYHIVVPVMTDRRVW